MSTIIISNDMTQPYSEVVTEALHEFAKRRICRLSISLLPLRTYCQMLLCIFYWQIPMH